MSFPTAPLWAQASLNDEVLPEATRPDWEFEYIDIGSVSRNHGVIATQRLTFGSAPSRARRVVRAGDVIVSTVRTYLRAVARISDECDGCVASTGFAVLRARRNADARFLGYAVVDPVFVDRVIALSVGVSYPAITPMSLIRMRIAAPDLITQQTIADFLDRESDRISEALRSAARLTDRCERLLATMTDYIPESECQRLKVGVQGSLAYGASENSGQGEPGWPRFIRITDIGQHGELLDDVRRLAPEVAKPYLLMDGDVLLARSGATVGKSFLYRSEHHGPCCFAGYLVRARCDVTRLLPEFLYLATLSDRWWDQIALSQTQATIPNVSAARYGEMRVPMPDIETQQLVVARGLELREALAAARNAHAQLSMRLQEHRDSLIHEAVTGKLDITRASERQMEERLHAASEGRLDEVAV